MRSASEEWAERLKIDNVLLSVQIELTKLCNQACEFCYAECSDYEGLSTQQIEDLLDEIKALGGVKIIYTGGEPFVRKDILDILRLTKKKGFVIAINTNGTLIDEDNIEDVARYVSEVYVSLHSAKEEIHDKIVNMKGSYKKVIKSIRLLKNKNVDVYVNTVVTNIVFKEIDELRQLIEGELKAIWNYDTRIEPTILDDKSASDKYSLDVSKLLEFNSIMSPREERESHSGICRAGRKHCFIDAEGNVYPCLNFKGASYDQNKWIENINDKGFQKIWNNNILLKMVRRYAEKDFEKCNKCINKDFCRKCMAHNFRETGSCVIPSKERCMIEIIDSLRR